jgi:hypothetical protein
MIFWMRLMGAHLDEHPCVEPKGMTISKRLFARNARLA